MSKKGIKQKDLLKVFEVETRGAVGHYLTGRREPSVNQLKKFADFLGMKLEELIQEEKQIESTVKYTSLETKQNELPSTISEGNQMIRLSEQEGAVNVLVSKHDAKIIEALKLLTYEQKTNQENVILEIADANKAIYLALSKNNIDTK